MSSLTDYLFRKIGELIEKGMRKCGAGHIYDFIQTLTAGSPRQRFDNAKMISDFVGMITRMSFLVVLSIFIDRAFRESTGIPYALLAALSIFIAVLLSLLTLGIISILASIVIPRSKKDLTETWMLRLNSIIVNVFTLVTLVLLLTLIYQSDRTYFGRTVGDLKELIRAGKAYLHEVTRPEP